MTPPIEIHHLVHAYRRRPVLDLEPLDLGPGRVHLAGPNGTGKTTLLTILATLTTPTRARVLVAGHALTQEPRTLRGLTGFAGHAISLHTPLPARDALGLHADLHGLPRDRVDQALKAWQLAPHASTPVHELSHGQAKRLDLARALIHTPRVVLLDEPATGLDADALALLDERLDRLAPELVLVAAPDAPGLSTDRRLELPAINRAPVEAHA